MQKKTEPETFEARIEFMQDVGDDSPDTVRHLCREADQRIAQLTTDLAASQEALGLCANSAPLELVELVEELIKALTGDMTEMDKGYVIEAAQATIERWKV